MARIRTVSPRNWKSVHEPWGFARTHLYLIQEGKTGPVKIGIAGHPYRRLAMLQSGNSRRLHLRFVFEGDMETCVDIEKAVQSFFSKKRLHGEWFKCSVEEACIFLHSFTDVET